MTLRGEVRFKLVDMKGACSYHKNAISNGYKQKEIYIARKKVLLKKYA